MIEVKCLASGSKGNSYAVYDGESALLLEAGIPAKKILSGYLKLLPDVAGCLITHEHMDHAKGAAQIAAHGIDLYATCGTLHEISETVRHPYRLHTAEAGKQFTLESWIVLPFEAKHDAKEPVGYLLYSTKAKEKLLFSTDSFYIPNIFRQLNIIMVECNFSIPILNQNIADGLVSEELRARLLCSHFSLDNVKAFLNANDMRRVWHIYLLHVSQQNGDKALFKREIQRLTGRPVTVF